MSNYVLRGCGIVLLAAVALKVKGLSSGMSSVNDFSSDVQLAALETGTVIGLWLLIGWARRPAWNGEAVSVQIEHAPNWRGGCPNAWTGELWSNVAPKDIE